MSDGSADYVGPRLPSAAPDRRLPVFFRVGDGPEHQLGVLASISELPGILREIAGEIERNPGNEPPGHPT